MRPTRFLLVAALVAATAPPARAEDADADASEPRLTVPAHRFVVQAMVEVSLSSGAGFAPVSLAPDVWYGVSSSLTVGLVHSSRATSGFLGGAGDALCLTGADHGCSSLYDNTGVLVRRHLLAGQRLAGGTLTAALDGGLVVRTFDPFTLSMKLGAATRWHHGKLAVDVVANVWAGLSQRANGNIELLNLPVSVTYALGPRVAVAGQLGLSAPFQHVRRDIVIATSVGAQFLVKEQYLIDVAFSLPHWLDTDIKTYGLDARTFSVGASRAF